MDVLVALGSNVGDRRAHLRNGIAGLGRLGHLTARSSLWETAPVDSPVGAGDFLNAAVGLVTPLAPRTLLQALLGIEAAEGRLRDPALRHAPRTLDLDLLLCGDLVLDEPGLVLPHPRLHARRFVLAPLVEIAPARIHPVLHRSMAALLAALPAATPGEALVRRLDGAW